MFVLIVGAGRVGSAVAKSALAAGNEVSVLDEDPLSHERLDAGQDKSWEDSGGQFTVGTALEMDALIQAGIERADVFIASTAGDNTNLVISQIAQKRFDVEKTIVLTFFIGGALAGAAGLIQGLYYNIGMWWMGYQAGLRAFTAAVLGGIGSMPGAALGGLLIGVIVLVGALTFFPALLLGPIVQGLTGHLY